MVKLFFVTISAGDTQKRVVFGCHPPKRWKNTCLIAVCRLVSPQGILIAKNFSTFVTHLWRITFPLVGFFHMFGQPFQIFVLLLALRTFLIFFSDTCGLMPGETSPIIKLSPTNITLGRLANTMGIIFMNLLFTKILILPITVNLGASSHFQLKVCCLDVLLPGCLTVESFLAGVTDVFYATVLIAVVVKIMFSISCVVTLVTHKLFRRQREQQIN